jgi:uncharacterized LabA/DUF88 family protein
MNNVAQIRGSRSMPVEQPSASLTDLAKDVLKAEAFMRGVFRPNERVALFIDGANIHATCRALGWDIDYSKARALFERHCDLNRAYYYTAVLQEDGPSKLTPLVDWLDYNGYTVVTKPAKSFISSDGSKKIKGNMDVEITVDIMTRSDHLDHIVLFSGDGDFKALGEAVQRRGKRFSVVSTLQVSPGVTADEIRRQADHFIELNTIKSAISRDPIQ